MTQNPFIFIAEEVKSINEYYKLNKDSSNPDLTAEIVETKIEKRIHELKNYAEKHDVPFVLDIDDIIHNVKNINVGEIDEDEYEDEYEDSESEYDEDEYDEDEYE